MSWKELLKTQLKLSKYSTQIPINTNSIIDVSIMVALRYSRSHATLGTTSESILSPNRSSVMSVQELLPSKEI